MQTKYKGLAADEDVIAMLEVGIAAFSTCYEEDYSHMYGKAISTVRKLLSKATKIQKGVFISTTLYTIPRKCWDYLVMKYSLDVILRIWLERLVGKSWATSNVVDALKQTIEELGKSGKQEEL